MNLIGRLKKLEELLIGDESFKEWDVVGCDSTEGMNASLTELSSLSHLAVFVKISTILMLPSVRRLGINIVTKLLALFVKRRIC